MIVKLIKRCLLVFVIFLSSIYFVHANTASSANHTPVQNKTFKIFMVLWSGRDDLSKGFMDYLKKRDISVEYIIRDANQDRKTCHSFVKEIREVKPDLIFTWGTPTCEEIAGKIDAPNKQDYIWDIPIVSLIASDPVAAKLINSLEKPGRNITGVNHNAPVAAQMEAMKSYFKGLKKIAALYNPSETNSKGMVNAMINHLKGSDIEIKAYPVKLDANNKPMASSLEDIILQIHQDGAEFIYLPSDTFISTHMNIVTTAALKYKLPTFGTTESMFFKGYPLMALLSRFYNVGLFGAFKAEQILLHGKKPEEIPYEKLKTFSLLISPDRFVEIGLYPPISMLGYAEIFRPKQLIASSNNTTQPTL